MASVLCALQHHNLRNATKAMHCLPDVILAGIDGDELHSLHAHTHQEHKFWASGQEYRAHGSTSPAPIISSEDLDLLDYPPMLAQDMFSLDSLLSDMDIDIASDNWSLPSGEQSLSSWESPEVYFLDMQQNPHVPDDRRRSASRCVDDNVPTGRISSEEELSEGTASPPLPNVPVAGDISPSNKNLKGMENASAVPALKPKRSAHKRRKSVDNQNTTDSCDCIDAVGDAERKSWRLNNLVSERNRRTMLKERLLSLRALVPVISKMDKASIVSDAINYVQELQKQVKGTQDDIVALQAANYSGREGQRNCASDGISIVQNKQVDIQQHKIVEIHVSEVDPKLRQLCICCKRGNDVLVKLVKAIEALNLEIVNASLAAVRDHALNTIVIKVDELVKSKDFKERLMKSFSMHGFYL